MAVDLNHLRPQIEFLKWAKQRKAEIAEQEKVARAAIEEALGDHDTGLLDDETAVTHKSHKRTALDSAALKKAEPETYALYSKTSEVRRFEITE